VNNITDNEFFAYLAGIVDGEGHISNFAIRSNSYIRIFITNTHLATLEAIQARLGCGSVVEHKKTQTSLGKKPIYVLCFNGMERAELVLLKIRPYLSIKREQADKALAIIKRWHETLEITKKRNEAILADVALGIPNVKIAKKFGISSQFVSLLKRGNLWPSRKKNTRPRASPGSRVL